MSKRIFIFSVLCAAFAVAATIRVHHSAPRASQGWRTTGTEAHMSPLARALRPNYPLSIIPGGTYTPEELRSAISHDKQLQSHYVGLDLDRLRLVKLTEDRFAYVSYREHQHFFWTKKKLRIPKGEILLTDGIHFVKTRCGNRLSDVPIGQLASREVAPELLSPPPIDSQHLSDLSFVNAPGMGTPSETVPAVPAGETSASLLAPAAETPVQAAGASEALPDIASAGQSTLGNAGENGFGGGGEEAFSRSNGNAFSAPDVHGGVTSVPEPDLRGYFLLGLTIAATAYLIKGGGSRFERSFSRLPVCRSSCRV